MIERPPFDPNEPFDALADRLRKSIADIACGMMTWPEYRALQREPGTQLEAILLGALTASCGITMAHTCQESHAELRAAFVAAVPACFDQARSIMELPPLPRADQ